MYYVTDDGRYILAVQLIDVRISRNLTQVGLHALRRRPGTEDRLRQADGRRLVGAVPNAELEMQAARATKP